MSINLSALTGRFRCSRMSPLLLSVAVWAVCGAVAVAQDGVASDRAALEALYDAAGGESWTDSTNWKTSAPLGEWYGVTTDAAGRVTELRLAGNALTGSIPAALGDLAFLQRIDLGSRFDSTLQQWFDNSLTGPIPSTLGNLVQLRWLTLGDNALTGPIPNTLGSLVNVENLQLTRNDLIGPVPASLGNLVRLRWLHLGGNALTGPVPDTLGGLVNLEELLLNDNDLSGPVPDTLGGLVNLVELDLSYSWGVSGPLPRGLHLSGLKELDIFLTQTCAPDAWQDWLATIEFTGRLCDSAPGGTIDVAVVYTPGAREAAGGAAAIETVIDLMIAETNQAYEESAVDHRVALAARSEVPYTETAISYDDLFRLQNPSDGHMDEVHELRDRTGADLVHLIVAKSDVGGRAFSPGVFGLTTFDGGVLIFAHELGHNMGLGHDRYLVHEFEGGVRAHPAYGYVNQRAFAPGAPTSSRWRTLMSSFTQCADAGIRCLQLPRFSNPRQRYNGDPLGIAHGAGGSGVTGPADAVAVLNSTGPIVALWRDRMPGANQPPTAARTLPDRRLPALGSMLEMDVSQAFFDPDRDALSYVVSSSVPEVATVLAAGRRVMLSAVGVGASRIRVTVTDPGGLSATQLFMVTVTAAGTEGVPFTDDPLVPGVTPVKEVHFTELRLRIDAVRGAVRLAPFAWTDRVLSAGVTPIRLVHLLELRSALAAAYAASRRAAPSYTDGAPVVGSTSIRAVHLMELRAALVALE